MKSALLKLAATGLAAISAGAHAQESIDGTYRDSQGYIEITVEPCGIERCGSISRIVRRKPGGFDTDVHNEDPALRDRPILGLTLLTGLRWDDDVWRGEICNPEDGETYRAEVRPAVDGALEVKGCLFIICQTRIWPNAG
jgi:uncharacterized protein (DUF2147 family)